MIRLHVLGIKWSSIVQAAGWKLGTMDVFFTSTLRSMIRSAIGVTAEADT